MKRILILNGSPRKNGNTAALVKAFTEGAESAGNEVKEFYLYDMDIHDCRGCMACEKVEKGLQNSCVQKDDMVKIYSAYEEADVIVFASPIYYWTVTGVLKMATDRLLAAYYSLGHEKFKRSSVLLSTAAGPDYSLAIGWHHNFRKILGWNNMGEVLGAGKMDEAKKNGMSIN